MTCETENTPILKSVAGQTNSRENQMFAYLESGVNESIYSEFPDNLPDNASTVL